MSCKNSRFGGLYIMWNNITISCQNEAETLEEAQTLIDEGDYEEKEHNHDFIPDTDEIIFDSVIE